MVSIFVVSIFKYCSLSHRRAAYEGVSSVLKLSLNELGILDGDLAIAQRTLDIVGSDDVNWALLLAGGANGVGAVADGTPVGCGLVRRY